MTVKDRRNRAPSLPAASDPTSDELQKLWGRVVGRRSFLRQAGLASAAVTGAGAVAASSASAVPGRGRDPRK